MNICLEYGKNISKPTVGIQRAQINCYIHRKKENGVVAAVHTTLNNNFSTLLSNLMYDSSFS